MELIMIVKIDSPSGLKDVNDINALLSGNKDATVKSQCYIGNNTVSYVLDIPEENGQKNGKRHHC